MLAVVLERKQVLSLRDIEIPEILGPHDVRIQIHTVGICGSDVHYYQHGSIGPFVVREPMVLGHEAAGRIVEVGTKVQHLKPGDRVCMEPGIPDPNSKATQLGFYNLDPSIKFWATPPVHGILREFAVHPAAFTYKLPENVNYGEGALVEPFAVGMHAANKAQIKAGDVAVVVGAGTIGMCTALAALAGGCSKIIISDLLQDKLDFISKLGPIVPVNIRKNDLTKTVLELTDGWGADILFEASGSEVVTPTLFDPLAPAGRLVYIGHPANPKPLNIVAAQVKEVRIETIFRYAHVFPRILALLESGKIDLTPLITETYAFSDSIKAFDYAINRKSSSVKIQISFPD